MTAEAGIVVELVEARPADLGDFGRRVQAAFALAVTQGAAHGMAEPIPSDEDLRESFDAPGAEVLHVVVGGERVGGAVVSIDREAERAASTSSSWTPSTTGVGSVGRPGARSSGATRAPACGRP
jgi:hypothetical protein